MLPRKITSARSAAPDDGHPQGPVLLVRPGRGFLGRVRDTVAGVPNGLGQPARTGEGVVVKNGRPPQGQVDVRFPDPLDLPEGPFDIGRAARAAHARDRKLEPDRRASAGGCP